MARYIRQRLLLLVPTLLGVATLVFFFIHMIPGDPVEVMLGELAQDADKEQLRANLGLDRPLPTQYADFLAGAATGNLGESFFYHKDVFEVIAERLPATVRLSIAAMIVALLIALPAGILAAVKHNTAVDHATMLGSLVGVAMPNFWLGPLLIILFSIKLGWFPVSGNEGAGSIVLPAITLGTALAAMLSRMTRSSVLEELSADYIVTARAKGLPERVVVLKHALRNALMPVITIVGLQVGALLSGAIITEAVFAWPGIGTLLIQAIQTRDYPLVQGCVLTIAFSYVLVNLVTDVCYALVDPRVRLGAS
ncbi:MAG: ABC transporter permease [Deltaproteobacteria bacterium]|nr:ABC transporter permease [Deltaproteobacteria bacterium]